MLTGCGPILNIRPAPPPTGTVQRSSGSASRLALMIDAEVGEPAAGHVVVEERLDQGPVDVLPVAVAGERPELPDPRMGGAGYCAWIASGGAGISVQPTALLAAGLFGVQQEDPADLEHGVRVGLHRVPRAHDQLRGDALDVGALGLHDAVAALLDRPVAELLVIEVGRLGHFGNSNATLKRIDQSGPKCGVSTLS